MQKSALAMFVTFALGWIIVTIPSSAQVVPKPHEWEYHIISRADTEFGDADELAAFLNEKGKAGWELCDVVARTQTRLCVFKRPKK